MNIRYEKASIDDIEEIFNFNKSLIDEYENISEIDYERVLSWVHKKIENNIQGYSCVVVDDKKVGYFFFHAVDRKMEIDDLYILKEYRNKGIGREIIKKCISESSTPVFLYVFIKNYKAVALYEKLGFKVIENIKNSRYVMEREI